MEPNTIIAGKALNYPTGSSYGAVLTANASANTKGSYAEIVSSLGVNCSGFYVAIITGAAAVVKGLIDLAIGTGGNEKIILSNIQYQAGASDSRTMSLFYVPISLIAGTRLSGRMQASVGSKTVSIAIIPVTGGGWFLPRLGRATTYGAETGDSSGISTDPGGTADAKGAYVQLSASITIPIRWLILLVGDQGNTLSRQAAWKIDVAIGTGGNEKVVLADVPIWCPTDGGAFTPQAQCYPVSLPATSRLAVRAQCNTNDATDRLLDISAIGIS